MKEASLNDPNPKTNEVRQVQEENLKTKQKQNKRKEKNKKKNKEKQNKEKIKSISHNRLEAT